ncbi:hypothetical protein GGI20_002445 [Coemansia sp. BCRC 34301]|nr:hypothetical protein GGI20_002445 [Coemansia sp. BCRC 34301]
MFRCIGLLPVRALWPELPQAIASAIFSRQFSKSSSDIAHTLKKPKRSGRVFSKIADKQTQDMKRSIWRKQFVLDNYDIPGKYQRFFTGRLRNRESNRYKRELEQPGEDLADKVPRVGARAVTMDEEVQHRRVEAMRSLILRILERHLSSAQLPVRQLSMQYWEITDHQIRKIIKESTAYLNMVVNQELEQTRGRGVGQPRGVNLKFVSGAATDRLMRMIEADVDQSEAE